MKSLKELDITKKKYIIFDMDGTLIDSIGIWNLTDQKIISQFSSFCPSLETIQEERDAFLLQHQFGEIYIQYCEYLIEKYQLQIDQENLLKTRRSLSSKIFREDLDYKENVEQVINYFQKENYTLILATATTQHQLDIYGKENKKMINKFPLEETFSFILKKEDISKKKPDPEIYLTILNYFQAKPEECLIFEDSLHGIMAATSAGIETINIYDQYSNKDREKINQLATYKINNYQEFMNYLEEVTVLANSKALKKASE